MILKHLCLSGMLGIIQSKITWYWGYILLPLLCSMSLISPNFDVKSIIFPQFWPRAFPQNCWKKPCVYLPQSSWSKDRRIWMRWAAITRCRACWSLIPPEGSVIIGGTTDGSWCRLGNDITSDVRKENMSISNRLSFSIFFPFGASGNRTEMK